MRTFTYPAVFEPGTKPDIILISFPDVPEAISQGDGMQDAHWMARDALGVALLGILTLHRPLPKASKPKAGQILVTVDPDLAAKIAVIEAFNEAGITKSDLARRLEKDVKEIRRILDPDHPTKMPALAAALAALGRRFVLGVEPLVDGKAA